MVALELVESAEGEKGKKEGIEPWPDSESEQK